MDTRVLRTLSPVLFLCLSGGSLARAQLPSLPNLSLGEYKFQDRLQRDTPRGAFVGFLRAAQRGRWQIASEYLQHSEHERRTRGPEKARQLRAVLDAGFGGNLDRISNDPGGAVQEGFTPDEEWVGGISLDGKWADVVLVRVKERDGPAVWLISRRTLDRVPELYEEVGLPAWESRLPDWLVRMEFQGAPVWKLLACLLALPVCVVIGRLLVVLPALFAKLRRRQRGVEGPGKPGWQWPAAVIAGLVLHAFFVMRIGLPLLHRQYYFRAFSVLMAAAWAWLILYWIDLASEAIRRRLAARANTAARSLLLVSRRVVKAVVLFVVFVAVLQGFGVNVGVALAGLGIGGVALALAAQKTLENLFGGVSVLSDRSIQVGDVCRIGAQVGEVEDIGLRSTAIRTLDRTLLYVPNGSLATMNLENLSWRDKFWFQHVLGLTYETTADQLRSVLDGIGKLLSGHAKVEATTARVRFLRFADYSLEVECFAYVFASDYSEFLATQEVLLLRIMDIVESGGTAFAAPPAAYVRRDESSGPADMP